MALQRFRDKMVAAGYSGLHINVIEWGVQETIPAGKPRIVSIYAWNEWTEGGYLEPHIVQGMGYLEAIRNVFCDWCL